MAKRVGLKRLQALLEQLNRTLNLQDSDLTIGILSGSTISASAFVGDGSGLTGISGGGSPGGSDTQVQFNSGSSFGGSSNLTFDYSSGINQLQVVGAISGSSTLHAEGAATFSSTVAVTGSVTSVGLYSTGPISGSTTLHAEGAATFSSTIAASSSVTAGSSFIIGSADLNETDLEKLDGITDGTAAANKAVVLDASKNIATIGTFGCGAITSTGASTYGSLSGGALSGSSTLHVVGAATFSSTIAASSSISASSTITAGSFVGANLNRDYVNNLILSHSSVTAVTVGTGSCTDSTNSVYIDHTASVNVVITDSGINGLDAGSEASSTWYAVFLVSGASGVGGLLSTSETAPTMPSGFTYKRRLGWVYNHSDDDLQNFIQVGLSRDRTCWWVETNADYCRVVDNGTSVGSHTSVDVTTRVPSTAYEYFLFCTTNVVGGTAVTIKANEFYLNGVNGPYIALEEDSNRMMSTWFPCNQVIASSFDYITYGSANLYADIYGWRETI